jgi:glycosyltransferase involved in cell wall biosynthesis
MKISIIVPIYNSEKHLGRCIDSLLSQTYSNIEVILVNDGSPDSSGDICEKYAVLDNRIIVIIQENRGAAGARNSGLKIATGVYAAFIDSDDVIESDMVSDFVNVATKEESDVICSNIKFYEAGNLKYKEIKNDIPYGIVLKKDEIKKYFLQPYYGGFMGIVPSACTKMYKISFLRENNLLFDELLRRSQDYWFNFDVFKIASTSFVIDRSYYHYYYYHGSQIRSYRSGVFEMLVSNRQRLVFENKELNFEINWPVLNLRFRDDANEHILFCIKGKGFYSSYKIVNRILKNKEFQTAYSNITANKIHIKFIQKLIPSKAYFIIHILYCIWSIRFKNDN